MSVSRVLMQKTSNIKGFFFQHINGHLRHSETVHCVFVGCTFKTNVYSTFNTHKNRKHNQHPIKDFKVSIISTSDQLQEDNCTNSGYRK